jgi:hypothetical protein
LGKKEAKEELRKRRECWNVEHLADGGKVVVMLTIIFRV